MGAGCNRGCSNCVDSERGVDIPDKRVHKLVGSHSSEKSDELITRMLHMTQSGPTPALSSQRSSPNSSSRDLYATRPGGDSSSSTAAQRGMQSHQSTQAFAAPTSAKRLCTPRVAFIAAVACLAALVASLGGIVYDAATSKPSFATTTTSSTTFTTRTNSSTVTTTTTSTITTSTFTTTIAATTTTIHPTTTTAVTTSQRTTTKFSLNPSHAEEAASQPPTTTPTTTFTATTTSLTTTTLTTTTLTLVSLAMTVKNVDYSALIADQDLCSNFRHGVKDAILLEVGSTGNPSITVKREHVHLDLVDGSVKVFATIDSLSSDIASVVLRTLNASSTLGSRVVAKVRSVKGVEKVTTGDVSITDIGVGAVGENLEDPMMNRLSVSVPLGFLIGGVCVCAVVVVSAIVMKQRQQAGKPTYKVVAEDARANGNFHHQGGHGSAQHLHTAPKEQQLDPTHPSSSPREDQAREHPAKEDVPEHMSPAVSTTFSAEAVRIEQEFIVTAADMGFTEHQARAALAEASGNSEIALDLLLAEQ